MVTTTTVYSFQKPDVSGDEDAWGGYLNANVDKYESILTGNTTITSLVITTADINGGTLDNVVIGGSTAASVTGTTITGTSLVGPLATAAQPNITSLGTLTTLTVDDITINGSTISDGGDLTFDVGGDLIIDVDGADVKFKDGGTEFAHLFKSGNNFGIYSAISDGDIQFIGVDGGAQVTALTLDMSDAGKATFNSDVVAARFVDSANTAYYVDPLSTSVLAYAYLQQSYGFNTALSGTTPTINAGQFSSFSLTTSGNTTFTFSVNSVATGYLIGFVLKLTAGGGHTITYPNTVDFAGGAAPDAPASGETDILVFTTIDAGTTWYGTRAIDAAS